MSDYVYVPQVVSLPQGIRYIEHLTLYDSKVFFAATSVDSKYEENYYQANYAVNIYSVNINGTELTQLDNYTPSVTKPEGFDGWLFIRGMTVDSKGYLWVVENWNYFTYEFPEDYDPEENSAYVLWQSRTEISSGTVLRKLDTMGVEILSLDLSSYSNMGDDFYCVGFIAAENADTGKDIIYLGNRGRMGDTDIYAFDNYGKFLLTFRVSKSSYTDYRFIRMPDGTAAFPTIPDKNPEPGNSGYSLQTIDTDVGALGETVRLPNYDFNWLSPGEGGGYRYAPDGFRPDSGSGHFYSGNGDYDIFLNNSDGVYGWKIEEDVITPLLNWRESGIVTINTYNLMVEITVTPDEHIVCINESNNFGGTSIRELLILTKTLRSEVTHKTVLTLATIGVNETLSYAVMEFNRNNGDYIIEIADYSEFITENDYRAGLTRLATDINAGNIPDIICTNMLPYVDFAKAGLFADIYQFIDADPDYDRDDFVQGAFRAFEVDGGLYKIFPMFCIDTVVGDPSLVGTETGWNMEEFITIIGKVADVENFNSFFINKLQLLHMDLRFSIDEYVDMENGFVNFNSPRFIRLLELTGTFPGAIDTPDYFDSSIKHQIADGAAIRDFSSLQWQRLNFGRDVVIKGWPTENRNGHALATDYESLSIADSSKHKDAAWAFVRLYLDKDWQLDLWNLEGGFPTNQKAFDWVVNNAPGITPRVAINGNWVEKTTQEDVDRIIALINAAFEASSQNINIEGGLWDIVAESSLDYYRGMITAEDAARIIQSRASIWVSERS